MNIQIDTERQVLVINEREISLHLLDILTTADPERFFRMVDRDGVLWAEKFERKSLEELLASSTTITTNPAL